MKPQLDEAALVCQARIVRTFKTKKADSVWPEDYAGPRVDLTTKYPEPCFGRIEMTLKAVEEPYYGGCSAVLSAEWACSRCKNPYVPGRFAFDDRVSTGEVSLGDIEALMGWNYPEGR